MPMHHWNPFSKERRLERRDTIIGWFMFGGLVMMFVCGLGTYFLAVGGGMGGLDITSIFLVVRWFPVVGLLMYLSGLAYGIHSEKTELTGNRKVLQQCRILARYAIAGADFRMVTDESEFEFLDRPKFYVKVLSPVEGSVEYQCRHEVFLNCGEGMMGDAEVQGQWLGAFRPYMGMQQTHVGQKF
jgi:hypothetical protein